MSKKLNGYFIYIRKWDLRIFDEIILKKYNLEKQLYVYVGSSNAYNMNARSSKWKNAIKKNRKSVNKDIKKFVHNLERFYLNELKLSYKDIIKNVYYKADVLQSGLIMQDARQKETQITNTYISKSIMDQCVLLSNRASQLNVIRSNDRIELVGKKHKSKQEFESVECRIFIENGKLKFEILDKVEFA